MSDKSWTFTTFTLSFTLSLSTCWTTFVFYAQKRLFIAENCNTFFGTSSAAASPYPVILEFIELVPSKKLKMYFYSLHYLIAALKSKLGMNLFQSHWLGSEMQKVNTFTRAAFLGSKNLHKKCEIHDKFSTIKSATGQNHCNQHLNF